MIKYRIDKTFQLFIIISQVKCVKRLPSINYSNMGHHIVVSIEFFPLLMLNSTMETTEKILCST